MHRSDPVERAAKIAFEVVRILDPDREAHEAFADPERRALLRAELEERHQRRLLDETLDAAQTRRELGDRDPVDEPRACLESAAQLERHHAAAPREVALRQL